MKQLKRAACLLVCAVALLSLSSCPASSGGGGGPTITVTITGAVGYNGDEFIVGVFPKGAYIGGDPPAGIIAVISGGSASGIAIDLSTFNTFEATDGAQYDLSVFINEPPFEDPEPDEGEQILKEMPKTITVNGDTVINTVWLDDYEPKLGPS